MQQSHSANSTTSSAPVGRSDTTFGRRLMWAKVAHPPWPLYTAEVLECDEPLVLAAGLCAPRGVPICRRSTGVEVRFGVPRPIPRSISQ